MKTQREIKTAKQTALIILVLIALAFAGCASTKTGCPNPIPSNHFNK